METYGKFIVSFIYAVAVVAVPFFSGDKHIDPSEGVAIAVAVCTAALTYLVPLAPSARWTKTAIGAVLAGLQVATTVIVGGVDSNDIMLIAFAVLSALGIYLAPAVSGSGMGVGWGSDTPTRA
jgi:hypothetical protein